MMKFPFSMFLFAAVFCISFSCRSLSAADDELKDSEKKAYKTDATYIEIAEDPEKYAKKEAKRCFKAIYNGYLTKLPPLYEKILQKPFFLLKIENHKKELPLLFPAKNEKLKKDITGLEQDQLITVYATIQQKVEKEDLKGARTPKAIGKHYYLVVDDIDFSAQQKENTSKAEINAPSDISNAEKVRHRLVDIQPKSFLDKSITFKIKFKDISNNIPAQIVKYAEISNDEYFVMLPQDTFYLPMLIKRDNENCVPAVVEAEPGALLNVYAVVKCVGDPADKGNKPMYYIILTRVLPTSEQQSPASAASGTPAPAPKKDAPPPAPPAKAEKENIVSRPSETAPLPAAEKTREATAPASPPPPPVEKTPENTKKEKEETGGQPPPSNEKTPKKTLKYIPSTE